MKLHYIINHVGMFPQHALKIFLIFNIKMQNIDLNYFFYKTKMNKYPLVSIVITYF